MLKLIYFLFLALVVLAPLPLGANREWSWLLLAGGLGVLAALWGLWSVVERRRVSLSLNPLLIVLFLAVCAWAVVQAWPGVPPDWQHPMWALAGEALATPAPGGTGPSPEALVAASIGLAETTGQAAVTGHAAISLAPDATWTAVSRLLAYGLSFFLAFQLCRDPRKARTLFAVLVVAGVVASVYGLVVFWGGYDTFLFFWPLEHRSSVHGTFVNRNHFATWAGLCLLCLLALFYEKMAVKPRNPAYELPGARDLKLEAFVARAWPYLAGLILLTSALILTHSRGGFLATAVGGVVLLVALNHRRRIGTLRSRLVLATAIGVALAAFFITSEVLLKRIDQSTAGMEGRLQAYELAADGIEDNAILGFGYGTFADSFRLYRDESLTEFFDKAHNTYLENLFELGWPAALALFACVAWLGLICLRGVRQRGRDWVYPATGLAATTLVAIHALVDFSLQIPATAVTYTALMGAACAQSYSSRGA